MLLVLVACVTPTGPSPVVTAVAPDLGCDAGTPLPVTVTGEGFAPAVTEVLAQPGVTLPALSLVRTGDVTGTADGEEATLSVTAARGGLRWHDAGTLAFDASSSLGLTPGSWAASVRNPDGQEAALADALLWAAPPSILERTPESVCVDATAATITLEGADFLVLAGEGPTVTIGDGAPLAVTPGDCVPLAGGRDGSVCATLDVTLDATQLALGTAALDVRNPAPAACAAPSPVTFTVSLPPEVTSVAPSITCSEGAVLRVDGERFPEDATVTVGGVPAAAVTWVDAATLEVVLAEGTPEGVVDVVVSGGDGCAATGTVEIVGMPDVFFVDPPAVHDTLNVQVSAWIADLSSDVTEAWLADASGARTSLSFAWDPDAPSRLLATVPAGLPAGSYALGFAQSDGCAAELADALTVQHTATVALDHLDPAYAWTYDHTPVGVVGGTPEAGEVGFVETPRLYLTPSAGTGDGGAVGSVRFEDSALLSATVPPGLAPGSYDVLVVNPDLSVGVLPAGLVVTEDRPPSVDTVTPPGLINTIDETITISGSDFRDPAVSLTCSEAGVERTVAGVVASATPTRIVAVVPSDDFGEAVCVVEVQNADGPTARWAALSIRNPAENLFPWSAGPELVEARRAPVGAAGRTSSVSRWVYAIGGDAGEAADALDSVERAGIGVYGDLDAWELLPSGLPAPLGSAAGLTVGAFVYVIGGDEGAGPVAHAWRAHILDPLEVPRFDALSIDDDGALDAGTWTWRIAALYDAADAANPGGESLAGDPITVVVPDVGGVSVALAWEPVDGAIGYRVYRTPVADAGGEAEWVADTVDTRFVDDGLATDPTLTPLPEGSLGQWAALPDLIAARSAPCIAAAADPVPDPEYVYLYVAGGLGTDGGALDSVERLPIRIVTDGLHEETAWEDAGVVLSEARWGCGGWSVDASRHTVVEADVSWVYFGGGEGDRGMENDVDAGRVVTGGGLEDWQSITSMSPARSGYGVLSASDFLYAFGGTNGGPSSSGASAELGDDPMPEVRNWNGLGASTTESRYFPGSASESAVIVLIGGATETADATRSTDATSW